MGVEDVFCLSSGSAELEWELEKGFLKSDPFYKGRRWMDGWTLRLLQLWPAVYKARGVWVLALSFVLFVDRGTVVLFNQSQWICRFRFLKVRNVTG